MPKEISKHIKLVYNCKNCRLKFSRILIALVSPEITQSEIKEAIAKAPFTIKACQKCNSSDFELSTYSFYHEEKLNNNA